MELPSCSYRKKYDFRNAFEGGLLALQQQQDDKNLENQEDFTELHQV